MALSDQEIELIAQRIVTDLTGRGGASAPASSSGSSPAPLRDIGIFDTIDEAVKAASVAFGQFDKMGLKKRNTIIAAIRNAMREHGDALAKQAFEETGLGRYEDKILKNQLVTENTPGTEDLRPKASLATTA
jgi:acyl-CoA reductase-like NAD-dependent aldehyde dehydrogenase